MGLFAVIATPSTLSNTEQADVLFDEMQELANEIEDLSMEACEPEDYARIRWMEKDLQKKQAKRAKLLGWSFEAAGLEG